MAAEIALYAGAVAAQIKFATLKPFTPVPSRHSLVYHAMTSADLMCSTDSSVSCLSLVSGHEELGTAVGVQLFCSSGHHGLLATPQACKASLDRYYSTSHSVCVACASYWLLLFPLLRL